MSPAYWDLLAGLAEEDAKTLLDLGSSQTFSAGEEIFGLGDTATYLFLVVTGRVKLTLPLRLGGSHQDALVEERLPGQLLGWSGLIPPHKYTLRAVTGEEAQLLALPRTSLLELFSARPEVGQTVFSNVAAVIGQRLQIFQTMWIREMQRVIESRRG